VDLLAEARCYKLTRTIGFVRAWAFEADPADPVAAAQATYVINASDRRATGVDGVPGAAA
jgi:acyl-coenzyme A thioesterase PaaI-like protein